MKKIIVLLSLLLIALITLTSCGKDTSEEIKWEITLDANGGTVQGSPMIRRFVTDGGTLARPTAPERQGYEFDGWYVGEAPFDFNAPITASASVVAKWNPILYTVTFDTRGGTPCDPIKVAFGEKIPEPQTSRDYHELIGWHTQSGSTWNFDASTVTSDLTLKAIWNSKTVNVTLNLNYDCEHPIYTTTINAGSIVSLPSNATRHGYQIEGW